MSRMSWIRKAALCGAASALMAFSAAAAEWHVTAAGAKDGDGSEKAPWDIQTAVGRPEAVKPGDTIWIHGGKYILADELHVRLQGQKDKPIIVRNWKNERVTVNAPLDIASSEQIPTKYCWIWGLEIQTAGTKNGGSPMNIGNSNFPPGLSRARCS